MTNRECSQTDASEPLSPSALARKQEMLIELQSMVRRRGVRRRAIRNAVPVVSAASLVIVGLLTARLMKNDLSESDSRLSGNDIALVDAPALLPTVGAADSPDARGSDHTPNVNSVAGNLSERQAASPTYAFIQLVTPAARTSIVVRQCDGQDAPQLVRMIDDRELIAALAQTGRNCGIVRVAEQTSVVCNSCDPGETIFDPRRLN